MLQGFLFAALGGGIGSGFRFLSSQLTTHYFEGSFPLSTFIVNMLGSFLIGVFAGIAAQADYANDNFKFLFITGFCGGFTTFSAFAYENIKLFQAGNQTTAIVYTLATLIVGFSAVGGGLITSRLLS